MDKHIWDNIGGLPLEQDDFKFDQDAMRRAFFGLFGIFGIADDEGYILSGCERSVGGGNISITDGFITINGEIFEVEAHTTPDTGDIEFWEIFEEFDASGSEVFEDSITRDTYLKRRARAITSAAPPALFTPLLAPSFFDKLKETAALGIDDLEQEIDINTLDIADINDSWSSYTLQIGDLQKTGTAENLTNPVGSIKFKVVGKTLHYNMNIGGDLPSALQSIDFSGIAAALNITLKAADQHGVALISTTNQLKLNNAVGVWNSAGGLVVSVESFAGDLTVGLAAVILMSGSIEILS